jgi:DNA-binding MarR family transcriptional regulator
VADQKPAETAGSGGIILKAYRGQPPQCPPPGRLEVTPGDLQNPPSLQTVFNCPKYRCYSNVVIITKSGGSMKANLNELAKRSHKDRHNMTRILNLLERNEFIYRRPDEKDKRLLLVYLTDNGKAIRKRLTSTVLEYLAFTFRGVSIKQLNEMQRLHLHILLNPGYRV